MKDERGFEMTKESGVPNYRREWHSAFTIHPSSFIVQLAIAGTVVMLAGCGARAASSEGTPAPSTVIVAKETGAAEHALTVAALPSDTPSATVPPAATPSEPGELTGEAHAQGATGNIAINLTVTNHGKAICVLQGPPDIALVDHAGKRVDVASVQRCLDCSQPRIGTPTSASSTTEAAQAERRAVALAPGTSARVFLLWSNWCGPALSGPVSVRLVFPGGGTPSVLDVSTDLRGGGRCDAPDALSTLLVGPYEY